MNTMKNKYNTAMSEQFTNPILKKIVRTATKLITLHKGFMAGLWCKVFNAIFSKMTTIYWRLLYLWNKMEYPENTTDTG